ncbi:MAG: sulfite exporter TauE/SafE family protein [Cocleimonas sp.]
MSDLIILIITGGFAGILAGMLGIGGGILIVPVFVFIFRYQGIDSEIIMHMAIGTSLATIVVTSLSSIRAHQAHGAIKWSIAKLMAPSIIIGAFIGSAIADTLPSDTLRFIFVPFMLLVAVQMAFGRPPEAQRQLPQKLGMSLAGGFIGSLSSILGIGGGALNVPFMTFCNVSARNAVATSAAIGFPIAVAGTIGFVISGWNVSNLPEWSLGYINLKAALSIVIISALTAPLGAKLTHIMPVSLLKKTFALLLVIVAIKFILE